MSPGELEAFLSEMEPDIRAADRDMHEIEALEKKGVTGAGKLPGSSVFFCTWDRDFKNTRL
jgi:Cu+-exporting ATPase